MISVENFYWVLYENLLKPSGLDCCYYYPFGTKENISVTEFDVFHKMSQKNHALFHFDQEPLYDDDLGKLYDINLYRYAMSEKWVKLLSNSEHSDIKKQICKKRYMLDWYYFYHGLASLFWFRDAQYIDRDDDILDAFLCLNHNTQDRRSYRIALLARLIQKDIVHRGRVSFHTDFRKITEAVNKKYTPLSSLSQKLIDRYITADEKLPWRLDKTAPNGDLSAGFGHQELKLWQRSLLHVVTETVFYEPKLHLTEKTFKPIVVQRPFILVAAPGNLRYLRTYGFQTFGSWIDESYDDIQDPDERLDAIVDEIARFAAMSLPELRRVHQDMQSVLAYNKRHFFGEFRRIIVNELVDNFDQCIRIWNNGRVDGRELPLHPDLDAVKQTLMQ
jgi:hypothetical protein